MDTLLNKPPFSYFQQLFNLINYFRGYLLLILGLKKKEKNIGLFILKKIIVRHLWYETEIELILEDADYWENIWT